LKAFLTVSPGSIVLLLPGIRDLASCHSAFPQPELDGDIFNFHPRIHLLPNPARFKINDIAFAATSVDSLFHLRKEEYFKRGIEVDPLPPGPDDLPTDTMANRCRHLLIQRSFYPIFPPPLDLSHEVNLDISHFDGVRMVDEGDLDYAPDVLILPSRLKQFSKVIHSTTTINPSFLSKGTYAIVSLAPRSAGTPKNRLKTEIVKVEAIS
jgi:DNA polymerase alpha subunit B